VRLTFAYRDGEQEVQLLDGLLLHGICWLPVGIRLDSEGRVDAEKAFVSLAKAARNAMIPPSGGILICTDNPMR
jgi:hypothetical protein